MASVPASWWSKRVSWTRKLPTSANAGPEDQQIEEHRPACAVHREAADPECTIQIMSDLHLEITVHRPGGEHIFGYDAFDCTPSAPSLALLGDVGLVVHEALFSFLRRQLRKYQRVLYVMGNHEGYYSSYENARLKLQAFADDIQSERSNDKSLGEFILLDRTRYDLTDNITILGCTLWTHIPDDSAEIIWRGLNDFSRMENWTVDMHNAEHFADAEWLEEQCARILAVEPRRTIVVFTHHAPTVEGTPAPRHQGSLYSSGFATDMHARPSSCWDKVHVWGFGHTHYSCDFMREGVRVVSNQRGYVSHEVPKTGFEETKVIQV